MPKHLTAASRDKIEVLLQENYSIKQIADKLSVHKTTIYREIKKGLDGKHLYSAWIGQVKYENNRKCSCIGYNN